MKYEPILILKPDSPTELQEKLTKNHMNTEYTNVFLGGTIDMGNSVDWQAQMETTISELVSSRIKSLDGQKGPFWKQVAVFNPRRESWNSSWEQKASNPQFFHQVSWEHKAMEESTVLYFHILGDSMSPITLMEIGMASQWDKPVVIYCEPGFWRRGNIEILVSRNPQCMHLYSNPEDAAAKLLSYI